MTRRKTAIPSRKLDPLKMLRLLADELLGVGNLSPSERQYLGKALQRICNGEDANQAFNLKRGRGKRISAEQDRKRLSFILWWIAEQVSTENISIDGVQEPLALEEACELATEKIVPIAKRMFPGADDRIYDAEYLVRCWYKPEYAHMRLQERSHLDLDSPLP